MRSFSRVELNPLEADRLRLVLHDASAALREVLPEQAEKHEREAKMMQEERRDEAFLRLRKTVHDKVTHFTDSSRTIGSRFRQPAASAAVRYREGSSALVWGPIR